MRSALVPFFLSCFACTRRTLVGTAEPTTSLRLSFAPAADSFRAATREYDSLWTRDGARIARALQTAAHLSFAKIGDTNIHAVVFEGVSNSGYREKPMQLRASYPLDT